MISVNPSRRSCQLRRILERRSRGGAYLCPARQENDGCWLRVASLCGGLGPPFAWGFGGKLTIDPAQIEPIKRGFLLSEESLNRFRFEELCSKIGGEMVEHVVFSQEPI
ncbi:hypothetical protein HLI18_30705 [Rhizobium laguerreae]|uniref:hypothetical protein n=1 Tax=Rhizobium laguerreae TaxID=1076926 RepID=UPI001478EF30|nr:hypothetical protein [Rhizobium laguerreae]NNG74158.1 hypothetical protein [Rhizobium laguerreae]